MAPISLWDLAEQVNDNCDGHHAAFGRNYVDLDAQVILPALERVATGLKGWKTNVHPDRVRQGPKPAPGPFLTFRSPNAGKTLGGHDADHRRVFVLRDLDTGFMHLHAPGLPVTTDDLKVPLQARLDDPAAVQVMQNDLTAAFSALFSRLYGVQSSGE